MITQEQGERILKLYWVAVRNSLLKESIFKSQA